MTVEDTSIVFISKVEENQTVTRTFTPQGIVTNADYLLKAQREPMNAMVLLEPQHMGHCCFGFCEWQLKT
jgi:hypothetical protein